MLDRDFATIARQYADCVISGLIPACKWTVAACLRQLDDLDRAATDAFPYRYEPERGAQVCTFLELLPHIKGRWKSAHLSLEPWQVFIHMVLFSWVHDGGPLDGLRRYRTDYEEVPRKNGKSYMSAGRALYMLAADNEQGAECYSAATTRDQARIVFDTARAMAKRTPAYCRQFGVDVLARSLVAVETESVFKPLSSDDGTLDGLNIHFANADELHAHKNEKLWEVLETATGAREQALLSAITTAGSNKFGVCYAVRTYLTDILNDVLSHHADVCTSRDYKVDGSRQTDETFFGIIYTIDEGDDWTDETVWAKANPNLGVSVKRDDIARLCRKAQHMTSAQSNFLTKRLNVWVNANTSWMDMLKWDACADPTLSLDQFAGEECVVGIDLASLHDLCAVVFLFQRSLPATHDGDRRIHYYAFGRFYLSEEEIEDVDDKNFTLWEESGLLTATKGNATDWGQIRDELRETKHSFHIREIGIDPGYRDESGPFSSSLIADGFTVIDVPTKVQHLSEPMKHLEAMIVSGRFHHDGNGPMTWMMSNVVAHTDRFGFVFPERQSKEDKIDGPVALITAMNRAVNIAPAEPPSIYETVGVTFV